MPDVLDCLANLSNDEVFTPPEIANRMLDLLPQEVFESKETTFLDPFTKSGVFLREITKRLLSHQIPNYEEMSGEIDEIEKIAIQEAVKSGNLDLQDADYDEKAKKIGRDAINIHPRVGEFHEFEEKLQKELNRILKTQVFGIAITELTAQLTRRSLYCSKNAAGTYSICTEFDNEDGNIRFKSCKHLWNKKPKWIELDKKWKGGTCIFCGANSEMFDRPDDLEQHAYEFIHTPNAKELFNMKFDVICGNPPYQLGFGLEGGNSANAKSIYNLFVSQAIRLDPKYLTMITPSRWMTKTAQGIPESWVDEMLKSNKFKIIHDYEDAKTCFPGVEIKGGVSYFLWEKQHNGECDYYFHSANSEEIAHRKAFLDSKNAGIVIRDPKAYSIINKIEAIDGDYYNVAEKNFASLVSAKHFFDNSSLLTSNWKGYKDAEDETYNIKYYLNVDRERTHRWISDAQLPKNKATKDLHKVFIPAAGGSGNDDIVLGKPLYGEPNSVCSQTFLVIGYDPDKHNFTKDQCENIISYIKTRFFRYLVSIKKKTQNGPRGVYQFVPMQDFSKPWTDEELYKKYGLTDDEIAFIESMIKPMDSTTRDDDKIVEEE
jgi:site-specific DNA-methyltransferase (adenine-specific)